MDLSPGQQKAVFVLVVVVLAALGYWLILPKISHSHGAAQAATSPAPSATAPASAPPQGSQVPQGTTPATVTPAPAASGSVNIYSWLPFTQQGLAAAAAATVKFAADYNTYSYAESPSGYVGTMNGLITGTLADTLKGLYATPGVAKVRTSRRQVSTGTAVIDSLRTFGPSSLSFIVTGEQHLVTSRATTNGTAQYVIAGCATTGGVPAVQAPTQAVATAISFAEQQLGKPYLWGGTRARRLRLLRPGDDGLPGGRDRHRPDLAGAMGDRAARPLPPRSSRGTWCSSPARTALLRRRGTSAW